MAALLISFLRRSVSLRTTYKGARCTVDCAGVAYSIFDMAATPDPWG